jgi:hypothetical protein
MVLMIYIQLVCFAVALGCGVAFLVTGRKNRLLSGLAGAFLIAGIIAQLLNRSQS